MNGVVTPRNCPEARQEPLSVEVTTRCNGSCLHCFARSGARGDSSLSFGLVEGIVAEGYDAGYRHLHITGGEPLLWHGLFEVIDRAFDLGYETVFVNTNGTLVTKEVAERLAAYGRNFSMSVSLDGPQGLHDRVRGKGSCKRTMEGIEKALAEGNHVTIFTTGTRSLLPALPGFAKTLYGEFPSIDCLVVIQLLDVGKGSFALPEELLGPDDFIRLVRMAALLNMVGVRTIIKKNPLVNVVCRMLGMAWIPPAPPLYREGSMIIMADGRMSVSHSDKGSLGRYEPGMIRKVLSSAAYRKAVAPDETMCPRCPYLRSCRQDGMVRPPQGYAPPCFEAPYCRRALDLVVSMLPAPEGAGRTDDVRAFGKEASIPLG